MTAEGTPAALRIVLAPSAYYPSVGGIEELTRQLALQLLTQGHDVSILTNAFPAGISTNEVLDGVPVRRLAFQLPAIRPAPAMRFLTRAPRTAVALLSYLHAARPDVVHIIGAGPQSVYLGSLPRSMRARLVFTAQGELTFDAHDAFKESVSLRAGLRRVLRAADAVTACSAFVLRSLDDFAPINCTTFVIPNGVSGRDFPRVARATKTRPYVVAFGRLVPQKGFDVLIRAFLDNRLDGVELKIGGDGFERERLTRLARDLGLSDRVHFLGALRRSEISGLLSTASVFAMPSRSEPFGIALLEALAAGVPSVATRSGGVGEFARHCESALLVREDDPSGLAQAISVLLSDAPLRNRLVRGGLQVANALDWSVVVKRYEQLYSGNKPEPALPARTRLSGQHLGVENKPEIAAGKATLLTDGTLGE